MKSRLISIENHGEIEKGMLYNHTYNGKLYILLAVHNRRKCRGVMADFVVVAASDDYYVLGQFITINTEFLELFSGKIELTQ